LLNTKLITWLGGRHRGNPLAKEWMDSGHNSRLNAEIRPLLAKAENQEEEYSSKYASTFFTEVCKITLLYCLI